jgi:hypothetical protein
MKKNISRNNQLWMLIKFIVWLLIEKNKQTFLRLWLNFSNLAVHGFTDCNSFINIRVIGMVGKNALNWDSVDFLSKIQTVNYKSTDKFSCLNSVVETNDWSLNLFTHKSLSRAFIFSIGKKSLFFSYLGEEIYYLSEKSCSSELFKGNSKVIFSLWTWIEIDIDRKDFHIESHKMEWNSLGVKIS